MDEWKEQENGDVRGMSGDNTLIFRLLPQPPPLLTRPHLPFQPRQWLSRFGPSRVDCPNSPATVIGLLEDTDLFQGLADIALDESVM